MTRSYSTYERDLNDQATRRASARRGSPTAGDYHRERQRDGHTATHLDRCPSGGGEAARWATDAQIPEFVSFGDHIFDFDLKHIATRCGVNVAASVDALCRPCEVCGLSTYGGGVCGQCDGEDEFLSVAALDADSAGHLGCSAYAGGVRGDNGRGADVELVF